MEGRLGEHLEDKQFFHYPHLDNTAKDYSWIAAPVVFPFMGVMVVVVVAVVVKAYGHRHPQPPASMDMPDLKYVLILFRRGLNVFTYLGVGELYKLTRCRRDIPYGIKVGGLGKHYQ